MLCSVSGMLCSPPNSKDGSPSICCSRENAGVAVAAAVDAAVTPRSSGDSSNDGLSDCLCLRQDSLLDGTHDYSKPVRKLRSRVIDLMKDILEELELSIKCIMDQVSDVVSHHTVLMAVLSQWSHAL